MFTDNYTYFDDKQALHGFVAYDDNTDVRRPVVMVVHDWSGRNQFACDKARALAELGYIGFALDMYGDGRIGETIEEKQALMTPFVNDRQRLLNRLLAGLNAVKNFSNADINQIAIIGFCFGGLCALDLARSGAAIQGAVSFHGLLNKPDALNEHKIKAKILALHGYDDPMVSPEQVNIFCEEMTKADADWQVHMYGHTKHAFANPAAHDTQLGTVYHELAAKRAWQSMDNFLSEIFEQ